MLFQFSNEGALENPVDPLPVLQTVDMLGVWRYNPMEHCYTFQESINIVSSTTH